MDILRSLLDLKNEVAVIARVEENPISPFCLQTGSAGSHSCSRSRVGQEKVRGCGRTAHEAHDHEGNGSGTRKQVNELFSKKGLTPNVLMETTIRNSSSSCPARGGISFCRGSGRY